MAEVKKNEESIPDSITILPNGDKELVLVGGKKVIITQGKGKHAREASKISDGDSSKWIDALMSLLITIDGKRLVMEDMGELPLRDYLLIKKEFQDSNF